jgi:hypothetical protein
VGAAGRGRGLVGILRGHPQAEVSHPAEPRPEGAITDRYHVLRPVAIRAARVSRTWPGVRRWTGGGIRAHAESVNERVMIACRAPAGLRGRGTDERRPW